MQRRLFDDGPDDETDDVAADRRIGFCTARLEACYNPGRDGPLDAFLMEKDSGTHRLFQGFRDFELLRNEGWLAPDISVLRVMWNAGRGDGHFQVTADFKLEGMENAHHGGESGIHDPAVLLENSPPFEAHQLWGPAFERWQEKALEIERIRHEARLAAERQNPSD